MKNRNNSLINVFRLVIIILLIFPLQANVAGKPNLVGPTRIYVDGDASGADNGTSWGDAYVYLQDALDQSSGSPLDSFEIWVAEGVYYPDEDQVPHDHTSLDKTESFHLTYNNVQMYGGFAGDETFRDQRDWETNLTVLSGDIDGNDANTDGNFIAEHWSDVLLNNSYHVVSLDGYLYDNITAYTVIDGFVITAGKAAGTSGTINTYGGGLFCFAAGSIPAGVCSPALRNLIIQGNRAEYGGAVMLYTNNDGVSSPTMTNLSLVGNYGSEDGGGMYTWVGNHASGESNPVLVNVRFLDNDTNGKGGGLYIEASLGTNSPILTNVEFYDNYAAAYGGGLYSYVFNSGTVQPILTNVTFSQNTAHFGGGMSNTLQATATFTMEINNTIIWDNNGITSGSSIVNTGAVPQITFSDIEGCGGSGVSWVAACGTDIGGNLDGDPLFVDSASGDLSLQVTSPAIDAGNQILLPIDVTDLDLDSDFGEVLPLDLAMNARVVDSDVDMGAYEHGPIVSGNDNVGFYVPDQLKWYLKNNQTNGWTDFVAFKFGGVSGSLAVSGDWNNDGVDTVGFYVPSQGKWYLKNNQINGWNDYVAFNFAGPSGSIPVAGDWDNDGVDTIGFYVPSQGKWYLKNNQINGWNDYVAFNFGGPTGSQPVAGDWDNDGVDTIGFYVPSQGKWYLKNNQVNGWNDFVAVNFAGASGSLAVAGDWDSDGVDTIGFYVPSQMKWYLKNNQVNGWNDYVAFKFGGPIGSQPVAGDWQ